MRGFTLLELLVVLAIVGLAVGISSPRLVTAYQTVTFAMERESFQQALADLPYQAYTTRRDLFLGTTEENKLGARSLRDQRASYQGWTGLRPVTLDVPESWKIEVSEPIVYRASGFCNGGTVTVTVGDVSERFVLPPPLCRPQVDQGVDQ